MFFYPYYYQKVSHTTLRKFFDQLLPTQRWIDAATCIPSLYCLYICTRIHIKLTNKLLTIMSLYFQINILVAFITVLLMTLYQYNTRRHTILICHCVRIYFKTCLIVHHLTIKSRLFTLRFPFVALPAAIPQTLRLKKELYIIQGSIKAIQYIITG